MSTKIDLEKMSAVMFARFRARAGRIIMPDVCCDLVWVDESLWLSGPQSRARPSASVDREVQLVNIDPMIARAWLGIPLNELTDQRIPLRDIDSSHAEQLSEMFHSGRASGLVRRSVGCRSLAGRRAAVAGVALRQGRSVNDVAQIIGLSERQTERLCGDWLGLSPKQYAKIIRLRRAVGRAKSGNTLAEASLFAGYADQSHFNRDMRTLAGTTPRMLLPHVGNVQDVPVNIREY